MFATCSCPPTAHNPHSQSNNEVATEGVHFGSTQGNRNCTGRNARHCALLPRVLLCAVRPSNTFTILPIMSQRFQGANQEFMLQQIVQSGGKVSDPQPARKQLPEIEKHATCFSRHPLQIQQEELHDARKACIAMH